MRKVLFKKWIIAEYISEGAFKRVKEGTNCWEKDFIHEGLFHIWGCSYEEFETGAGNFTVALVELSDGTIESVLPTNIKFIENVDR